jgi:hypothetical protein
MTSNKGSKGHALLAGGLAFLLAVYTPLQACLMGGVPAIVSFFAADAFYYLSIAVHSSFGKYSFDGTALTNGFHPFWQILLQLAVSHLSVKSGTPPILVSFFLSVLAASLGLAFLAVGIARTSRAVWPVVLLFPGAYYWLAGLIDPRLGSVWSFMNGMESPLSILFFGVFFLLLMKDRETGDVTHLLLLSVTSLCLVLSRLDDVFLVFVFAAWLVLMQRKLIGLAAAIWLGAIYLAPVVIGLGAYLVFNLRTVGVLLPTSGMVKSDHLGFLKNLVWLLVVAVPFTASILRHLSSQIPAPAQVLGISLAWRLAQMLAPMAIAALLLIFPRPLQWIARSHATKLRMLLYFVLAKGGYNLLLVPLMRQGHWYYATSILILNTVAALAVARLVEQYGPALPPLKWAVIVTAICVSWLSSSSTIWRVLTPYWQNSVNIDMLARGPQIRSELQSRLGAVHMIEFDDGIVNYALATPTLSGFGLAADANTARALRSGDLLSYAASQGFNLIGTANYHPLADGQQVSPEELRKIMSQWSYLKNERDLDQFKFSVLYVDPVSHAQFIEFTRR